MGKKPGHAPKPATTAVADPATPHAAHMRFWARIVEHRTVQWLVGYLAFSYACLHTIEMLSTTFAWPVLVARLTSVSLLLGFPVTAVLSWYFHGTHHGAGAVPNTPPPVVGAAASAPPFKSIAVLPFLDMSALKDQEYFSDGLSEELIGVLTRIPDLRVPARTSSFFFKGKQSTIAEIAQALHVAHVLEGSVRKAGDTIRITVQLIQADNGYHVWSETYDRTLDDIFKVQDEIAAAVVRALKVTLLKDTLPTRSVVPNAEAYQLYLRGRFHWNRRSPEDFRKAVKFFQQATAIDSKYPLALTGLADCYSLLPLYDRRANATESTPLAKEAVLRALSMDEGLAEAHASLGLILAIFDFDWLRAERHFRRSIELSPNASTTHQWYGTLLVAAGRAEEGLAAARRALELDPLSLAANLSLGIDLNSARRFDAAIAQLHKTLELGKNFADTNYFLYEAYANKGMYKEAVSVYAKQKRLEGEAPAEAEAIKEAYASGSWQGFLRHRVMAMEAQPQPVAEEVASFYARLGDVDRAMSWLQKAYERRSARLTLLKVDPRYDNLRKDPRFAELLQRVGLGGT